MRSAAFNQIDARLRRTDLFAVPGVVGVNIAAFAEKQIVVVHAADKQIVCVDVQKMHLLHGFLHQYKLNK